MRMFVKLSIAAVAVGAMLWTASAFAAPVTADSPGKLDVGGIVWVMAGYYQANESASDTASSGTAAPPATLDIADEARLNVSWSYDEKVTAHWELWQREDAGQAADTNTYMMGWITWKPMANLMIEAGQLEDPSWTARAVEWEVHNGTNSIGSVGAFGMGFPENSPGVDITFDTGAGIKVGVLLDGKGLVTGTTNDPNNFSGSTDGSSQTAQTYALHLEYNSDILWAAAAYYSENGESQPGDGTNTGTTNWDGSSSYNNTGYIVGVKANFGVGDLRAQYWGVDGDAWKGGAKKPSDMAATFRYFLGGGFVALEYDLLTNGGTDDKGKVADAYYYRVAYRMPIATNSNIQIEYEAANNGNSTASKPGVGWSSSF